MTTFHIIHIIAGAWLILAPMFDILRTAESVFWNNIIVGTVVLLYNLYYLFARQNVDTTHHSQT